MTTLDQAVEAIYDRFLDNWDDDTYPVHLEPEKFTAPSSKAWVRLTVRNNVSRQVTLGESGNRKFDRNGIVLVQVFTPTNVGRKQANDLAQLVLGIFEGVSFSGLDFYESDIRELGSEGSWYQVVVESKFTYNEIK